MMGYHDDFIIDGKPMDKIYARIAEEENVTLVLDIGSPCMASCQPEAVARIAQKYPNLHIVVCHLLAPGKSDRQSLENALPYLKHDNVWVDLSALPWNVSPEAYPYPTAQEYISLAKSILGAEKMIWGTDLPTVLTKFEYKELYRFISESDIFTEEECQKVLYDNAVQAYYL